MTVGDDPGLRLLRVVLDHHDELLAILCEIATHQAAVDELRGAAHLLTGSAMELARHRPKRQSLVATFLSSNNILYSYVLYGVMPALFADEVVIRPARIVADSTQRIHDVLGDAVREITGSPIHLLAESQHSFRERCREAQAVVFNGRFENGTEIARDLPDSVTVLGFCSGPNPMIIGPAASVEQACDRLLDQRLFNSGQDCLCTDLVFVHSSLVDEVTDVLTGQLSALRTGERADPATRVSPLYYGSAVTAAAEFLDHHREWTVHGGSVDVEAQHVQPTILRCPPEVEFHPPEFFAPIFALRVYDDPAEPVAWLKTPVERRRGMYVSIFGEHGIGDAVVGTSVVCREATTFDVEDGNVPFGGYGEEASFVWTGSGPQGRPLLLSAEVSRDNRGGL